MRVIVSVPVCDHSESLFLLLLLKSIPTPEVIMSGLEAFSLACNIMTVITFALNTAEVCRNTRESGSSDKNLEESTEYIGRTLNNVERLLQQQPTAPTKAEIDLRELATKCIGYNEAVQKELKKTSPKDSTKRAALGSTIKTMMRRPHIDKLKSRLEAAQKVMDSALSVQILNECMKSRALNHATYSALDQYEKHFSTTTHSLKGFLLSSTQPGRTKLTRHSSTV
jgi:hypothetical protein